MDRGSKTVYLSTANVEAKPKGVSSRPLSNLSFSKATALSREFTMFTEHAGGIFMEPPSETTFGRR